MILKICQTAQNNLAYCHTSKMHDLAMIVDLASFLRIPRSMLYDEMDLRLQTLKHNVAEKI